MPEDETIGRIIQRDLDRLPVLAADRWLPQPRRKSGGWLRPASAARLAKTLSIGLTVVVVAVAAGLGLADWRAHRTPTDEPQAASAIPGPLNLAGGAPSLGFGLVSTSANTLLVRSETTESAPLTFSPALPQVAVSPNGHEIAYWRVLPDRQTGQASFELVRSDVLDPAVRDRLLMRAAAGEAPGSLIWSSDGTGLLANTHTPPTRGSDAGTAIRPTHATWFTIDVASGKTEKLPQTFADAFSVVYAWDGSRDLITGSTISFGSPSVAGGPTFLTFKGGVIESHPLPNHGLIAAADAYGKSVVIAYAGDCKGFVTTARCPVLEVHDQATFATITASPVGEATTDYPDVVFRPRSQDLIVQLPLQGATARVELWNDLGRGSHQILASYSQSVRFTARRELMLPRIDGSAAFLLKFDDSAGGRWFGELVGLSPVKGATGFERTPFEIRTGGNPLASIVLDPAFARAMDPRLNALPRPSNGAPTCVRAERTGAGSLEVCPGAARVGTQQITLQGTNCGYPGGVAIMYFGSANPNTSGSVELGRFQQDPSGSFRASFTVPAQLNPIQGSGGGPVVPGEYRIYSKPEAFCQVAFEVTASTAAPSAPVRISPSPLPSGVVDPQPLIDQATHLGSIVLRVDSASASLATMADFTSDSTGAGRGSNPAEPIWVIAIRGDIRIDAIVDLPPAQCALFAYDAATGQVRASRSGPASICDPYFK